MWFVVQASAKKIHSKKYPYAVLVRDKWDDFGYKSTFNVTLHLRENKSVELGDVKIVRADQRAGETKMPAGRFKKLGKDYASVGASFSYYEALYALRRRVYGPFLRALRDIALQKDVRELVQGTEAYKVSLLRFTGAELMIHQADSLLNRTITVPKRRGVGRLLRFQTKVVENTFPVRINIDFRKRGNLPNRINTIIGTNGTGKTVILSNMAIAVSRFGYETKQALLEDAAGTFLGVRGSPFKTVVVVSYSAFDTFRIPGRTTVERQRLNKEGEIFGYVYCGLRERASNGDATADYRLRTPAETEDEYVAAVSRIRAAGKIGALSHVLQPLLADPSFQRIGFRTFDEGQTDSELRSVFGSLSSGHKIVLKIIADLTANLSGSDDPKLVLIDEPETHLHPPLLGAFIKSARLCLGSFNGFAVIATHSPVVLQETPSRFVHVVKRVGAHCQISKPSIETFGESIGLITQEVFSLDDGAMNWHDTLRNMAKHQSLEEIETLFGNRLGFGPRSFVTSSAAEPD